MMMSEYMGHKHQAPNNPLVTVCGDLPILSWNIHDSVTSKEGPKTNDNDFVQVLSQSAIFCLQETKGDVYLQNYECFNNTRPDSRSGGVCIGVHRSLSKEVKLKNTDCHDFQALTVFPDDEKNKFTIINVYDSPEQSSYKAKRRMKNSISQHITTLELILEFKNRNPDIGELLLVGDLNARTGNANIEPYEDELEEDLARAPSSYPEASNRTSKDRITNSRGTLLLDFLACCKLSILNGSLIGDILGEFTSVNYNGASVVDYIAATPILLETISMFKVLDLTKFSDHRPCLCRVKRENSLIDPEELLDTLEDVPSSYRWGESDHLLEEFLSAQNSPDIKTKIENIATTQCNNKNEVFALNKEVVSVFHEIADSVMPKKATTKQHGKRRVKRRRIKPKAPWFDSVCINSKRELNRLAKKNGKHPTDKVLRENY